MEERRRFEQKLLASYSGTSLNPEGSCKPNKERIISVPSYLEEKYSSCPAGKISRVWDLSPYSGSITPNQAVCMAATKVQKYEQQTEEDEDEDKARGEDEHYNGMDILIAALMQAKTIYRERRRRSQAAKIEDCVRILLAASRKSSRMHLNESEAIRRELLAHQDDEDEQGLAIIESEVQLKNKLASELSRVTSEANALYPDYYLMRKLLQAKLSKIVKDFVK
mmetsp:Transcript_7479/g.13568  ORF Transcript_7479/g.13568 Transcript_7479/m.13568 type:complete len:223 (-) Transcript_7479:638-1306(-)|eukprot:CAMPEP_0203789394 /NCGR_PEP_ID=MMETSP0100_2-20121128/3412_1 /ASSEMBLY_ACC=CAM_ASM_000210 /TAXON_ID=96639 /ORGANISM=" , Strain NY0313808BC1" /LENGTH=222 /DNA_ID=CAMNT_0050692311 /DNA_START=471 /DNA_END=1139 /DNA_ORIENTATION=+